MKSAVVVDEKGSFVSVDGQRRVCDVKVGGQPIDLGATYTVASHTFLLRDGGDGMSMFVDNDVVVDEGITDIQVLIDYVSQDLGGVIGAGYENAAGAGRITETDASGDGDGGGSGGSEATRGGGRPLPLAIRETALTPATGNRQRGKAMDCPRPAMRADCPSFSVRWPSLRSWPRWARCMRGGAAKGRRG